MTEKQKDFPELEGKEITYILSNDEKIKGIVDGCNYDIGVAIRNLDRSSGHDAEYLLCMTGPAAPNRPLFFPNKEQYDVAFYYLVDAIKEGVVYSGLKGLNKGLDENFHTRKVINLDYKSCPFSQ